MRQLMPLLTQIHGSRKRGCGGSMLKCLIMEIRANDLSYTRKTHMDCALLMMSNVRT